MLLNKSLQNLGLFQKIISKNYRELLILKIEKWYKHRVEKRVFDILRTTGLVPLVPHEIDRLMTKAPDFTDAEFETEATISSLTADEAENYGYSGAIVIAPFACLIGRLLKAVLTPNMRKKGFPIITIENDGHDYPPNVRNQIEIFMLNALRFQPSRGSEAQVPLGKDKNGNGKKVPYQKQNGLSFQPVLHVTDAKKKDSKELNEN
jgi:predicted nucleotide-binding protein (sugar kinase/HSP70/actin superfamily)